MFVLSDLMDAQNTSISVETCTMNLFNVKVGLLLENVQKIPFGCFAIVKMHAVLSVSLNLLLANLPLHLQVLLQVLLYDLHV
jgi:hypothetical protein